MATRVEKLYEQAMRLGEDDREALLLLLTNVAPGDNANNGWASPEIEQEWMEEIERRERAYAKGEVELIPAEEVFCELRKIVAE